MKPIKNIFAYKKFPRAKSNLVQKGIPIGFEIAEKKVYKQTDCPQKNPDISIIV